MISFSHEFREMNPCIGQRISYCRCKLVTGPAFNPTVSKQRPKVHQNPSIPRQRCILSQKANKKRSNAHAFGEGPQTRLGWCREERPAGESASDTGLELVAEGALSLSRLAGVECSGSPQGKCTKRDNRRVLRNPPIILTRVRSCQPMPYQGCTK